MSEELKPCPFCGSDDIDVTYTYVDDGLDYYAECTDCYCRGAWEPTAAKARAAWNTRPIEDKLQARIDALEWLREVEAYDPHTEHPMYIAAGNSSERGKTFERAEGEWLAILAAAIHAVES